MVESFTEETKKIYFLISVQDLITLLSYCASLHSYFLSVTQRFQNFGAKSEHTFPSPVTSNEKTSFVVVPIKSLCSAAAMRVSNFWQGCAKLSLDSKSLWLLWQTCKEIVLLKELQRNLKEPLRNILFDDK